MPTLPGFQSFELVTSQKKVRLPLDGTLTAWQDESEHRIVEHTILGKAGALHQSNAQGPRRWVCKVLLRDPGASDRYKFIDETLAGDPFGTVIHARIGQALYVYRGLKVVENLDEVISGLIVEIRIDETGLRDTDQNLAPISARSAQSAASTLLDTISAAAQAAQGLPLVPLVPLATAVSTAADAFVPLTDDPSTDQLTLAAALVQVGGAVDDFVAAAGTSVANYRYVSQARLAYGQALTAYQQAGAQLPPILPFRVPGRMSLPRLCQMRYGGGAQAMETEVLRLNPGAIPNPYAIESGTWLLMPDPERVTLFDKTTPIPQQSF